MERAGDSRPEVGKVLNNFQVVPINGDGWRGAFFLGHDVVFFQADSQSKLLAGVGEATDKLLQAIFSMGSQGCVIGKENLMDLYLCDFSLGAETSNVEQLAASSSVDINSLVVVLEGALEEHGEEDAEERRREDTTLFDSATDEEGLRCCAVETNRAAHVNMKQGDHSQ